MMGWRFIGAAAAALTAILFYNFFPFSEKAPTYTFLHHATTAPQTSYYDYIIVGGGTAACPLAATLSQNATVLVLESGGSPYGNPNVTNLKGVPGALSGLPESQVQRFASEDGVTIVRPRVLGGGSSINFGFWSRAETEFIKNAGLDEELVEESFRWAENSIVFEPVVKQWQSAVRNGLLEVGEGPYNGFTYEHLFGTKVGGTIFDKKGHRHTAADLLKHADPNHLSIFLHATVQRILFETKADSRPTAHGVIFTDASGVEHRAYLKAGSINEIIVSAGALGSPQLLMLSGLGPREQLEAQNIEVVLEMPLVGQGMADNPMNAIFIPSPSPVEVSLVEVVGITRAGSYIEEFGGINLVGPINMDFKEYSPTRGGFILEKAKGPLSEGYMEIRNLDPNDNPSVRFNYFKEPLDLERCVYGIKTIEKVIESKAFSKFRLNSLSMTDLFNITANFPLNALPVHVDDCTSAAQFCKSTVMSIGHYHGGCQVGKVIDHDHKVLGVDALRVIDGSTFDVSPGTNPQATVMMLGRYMGVKILRERFASDESKWSSS